jgi:hypothetical protein
MLCAAVGVLRASGALAFGLDGIRCGGMLVGMRYQALPTTIIKGTSPAVQRAPC